MHKEYFDYLKAEQIRLLQTLEINSDENKIDLYNEQAILMQLVLQITEKPPRKLKIQLKRVLKLCIFVSKRKNFYGNKDKKLRSTLKLILNVRCFVTSYN